MRTYRHEDIVPKLIDLFMLLDEVSGYEKIKMDSGLLIRVDEFLSDNDLEYIYEYIGDSDSAQDMIIRLEEWFDDNLSKEIKYEATQE